MRSGQKSATIDDVARLAGVSRAAVSKVIRDAYGVSDAMRAKVNAAIVELEFRPSVTARAVRGPSYSLGLEATGFDNPFFTQILRGATAALNSTRYQLLIAPSEVGSSEGYRAIEALTDRNVDGLIMVSPLVDPTWLELLAASVPVVMIGRHDTSQNYDTIVGGDARGTALVMDHLLSAGHKRIMHLTRSETVTDLTLLSPHGIRLASYLGSMRSAGLAAQVDIVRTGATIAEAHASTLAALQRPSRPSAIFAGNDQLALGALSAIADVGVSASDIAVVGYDDVDMAAHPGISLTSVNQDGASMGRKAIEMLLERIEGRKEVRRFEIVPELRVRSSSTLWTAQ